MVDLRTCEGGDLLITVHGVRLKYLYPLPDDDYYDHRVQYIETPTDSYGSRTHSGQVFRHNRLPEDQDIVKIIKWKNIFEDE